MPKGSTVEKLILGGKYSSLRVEDEGFNASIDISSDDRFIETLLYNNNNYKSVSFTINDESISYEFNKSNFGPYYANMLFDKNGISVTTTNNTTYNIHEPQLSTIVNACEYSYDEYNSIHKLKMLPKVNNLNLADTPLEINFGKASNEDLIMRCDEVGLNIIRKGNDYTNNIIINDSVSIAIYKNTLFGDTSKEVVVRTTSNENEPDIVIEHKNTSGEINADKIIRFTDRTNSINVEFTVAELIALKALLPTT